MVASIAGFSCRFQSHTRLFQEDETCRNEVLNSCTKFSEHGHTVGALRMMTWVEKRGRDLMER